MFSDESSDAEFWCPLGEDGASKQHHDASNMTVAEHASLSRLALGDWLSDVQITRLEELGFVERVFGQALLTRSGRAALNSAPL
jgi:hypothetical protein